MFSANKNGDLTKAKTEEAPAAKEQPKTVEAPQEPTIAVKTRQQVAAAGGKVTVDFYLINEKNVRGNHQLKISVTDSQGKVMEVGTYETEAAGNSATAFARFIVFSSRLSRTPPAVTILLAVAGYLVSTFAMTPQYEASATLIVNSREDQAAAQAPITNDQLMSATKLVSQAQSFFSDFIRYSFGFDNNSTRCNRRYESFRRTLTLTHTHIMSPTVKFRRNGTK